MFDSLDRPERVERLCIIGPRLFAMATEQTMTEGRRARLFWFALLLALVVGLPFLNKPFQIDDTVVLAVAQQIVRHPLRPFDAPINWLGDFRPLFTETTNPPFVSYYLAPLVARFGFTEIPLHVAMLGFLVVLAIATAALSQRFVRGSAWPVLFVMLSPAVVVSTNVMRDVPLAALSVAAVTLFVYGVDRRRWPLMAAGAFVAGLAILSKYSGVVLLPALALYALLQRRGRYAFWIVLPIAMLGLWSLDNYLVHGRIHLAYLMSERRGDLSPADRFYPALVIIGACLFLAPALIADTARRRRFWLLGAALFAAGLAFWGARMNNDDDPLGWQYILWLTTGAAATFLILAPGLATAPKAIRRDQTEAADTLFLALWAGGVLAFTVFFVMFQAVRHIIPAIPPLALLAMRLIDRPLRPSRWFPALLGALVVVQAVIAFAVAAADYEYAQTYRDFAQIAKRRFVQPGRETWFLGNWGWQRYALSASFTLLGPHGRQPRPRGATERVPAQSESPMPRINDLVLVPDRVHKGSGPEGLELTQIEEKTYRGRIPIHTMDGSVGASFYATTGTSVPYAFTRERTLETFRVFRVKSLPRQAP
jgi:4-amino-4-deoxy-L-arabinose transferase-like glycosyltransferase